MMFEMIQNTFIQVEREHTTPPCPTFTSMVNFVKQTSVKLTIFEFCASNFLFLYLILSHTVSPPITLFSSRDKIINTTSLLSL